MAQVVEEKSEETTSKTDKKDTSVKDVCALIVIDVQKDYWDNDKKAQKLFPEFPEKFKTLMAKAGGFQKNGHLHIVQTREIDDEASVWMGWWDAMNPKSLAKDAKGDDVGAGFCPLNGDGNWKTDKVVYKKTFDAFHATDFDLWLRGKGVNTLYFCGLDTSMCVLHTTLSAFARGYKTFIIIDVCGDGRKDAHDATATIMGNKMSKIITTDEFKPLSVL